MSRPARISLIAAAVLVFVALSLVLARFLQLENIERDDIISLLRAQARGDAAAMLGKLHACAPACRAAVRRDAATLRGPGPVLILNRNSGTAYTLTSKTALTRIAWKLPARLPVVQCVLVQRKGNVLTGLSISLLALSRPINPTADC